MARRCSILPTTPRISEADTDANFVMTGDGRIIEGPGHRGKDAVLAGRIPGADGIGAERRCAAGGFAKKWRWRDSPNAVMPGVMPGIHVCLPAEITRKTWMARTSPAMTGNLNL